MKFPCRLSSKDLLFTCLHAGLLILSFGHECGAESSSVPPMVAPRLLMNGQVIELSESANVGTGSSSASSANTSTQMVDVFGCCSELNECEGGSNVGGENDTPTRLSPQLIGRMPQMTAEQALEILQHAKKGWNSGYGIWPQMSLGERIRAIEKFVLELQAYRTSIIDILMWEIGKNLKDATSEFDRTMKFIEKVIQTIREDKTEFNSNWQIIGSVRAFVRRAAIGIIMCLGPYNYPLNETYATLIPALLMGNVVIMKIPTVGGLAHLLTMEAFSKTLPPGTIHFVSGSGRTTMPPIMASGSIDGLAFIGGSKAADDLIRQHPNPHRLKLFLQLEAKNMGVFTSDVFDPENDKVLQKAVDQVVLGSMSYNGQRCTALKILFVPSTQTESFLNEFVPKVEELSIGLPWGSQDGTPSKITPLPNQKRLLYMKSLIEDAVSKGSKVVNKDGGTVIGGSNSTLMIPAVLFPVLPDMDVYHEEQFGPVIPIVPYDGIQTIFDYAQNGNYGQQVSIFTAGGSTPKIANMVDLFSTIFGKINMNMQCGRSPDVLPFSGRRSSAMGTMSVKDALREFSIPMVVSYQDELSNTKIMTKIENESKFMEKL